MLDARQLRNVLAIIEKGSVRRAADSLGISQPALTKSISRLEEQLQVSLFQREARGMRPTLYGRCLGVHAQALGIGVAQALAEIEALRAGAVGIVSIAAPPVIANEFFAGPILRLKAEHPQVEIRAVTRNAGLIEALLSGQYDFIAWAANADTELPGLERRTVHLDRLVVIARPGHPAIAGGNVTMDALKNCSWILPGTHHLHRQRLDHAFEAAGIGRPHIAIECDDTALIKRMVTASDHIGLVPQIAVDRDAKAGLIDTATLESNLLIRPIALLWRQNQVLSSPARLLMSFIETQPRLA
jgi:DNA-binding transcriptional LysR family regulator